MFEIVNTQLIKEIISSVFIFGGVTFIVIATIGILRFPDFYIRMSAITKAGTLGVGLVVGGIGIYFNEIDMMIKVISIILFVFLTSPVAAHVIGRTAIRQKIPFWQRTDVKEFLDYLEEHHIIKGKDEDADKVA
ncbi:MAG: monovalent cation/H(+) antiporter subunit G [Hymenobacteraceae bacterium]|mgnify:CR=1 FL=1|nr:monovalent cation/H(+) antiporter subunit G [Hymenobacteraceae bacterium]MDX5396382.1 monovalent cation/H(+) antiporter subunit G [Hymenobacteraceae bacterium]MDX5512444.1 monovalent cation/H(+) antiporter subunit G [Hymenobacteraceae bacterium]